MAKKLLLIDAMNLVFRAYFAFVKRPLRTTEGFNTGAIFGFVKMVRKALEDVDPTHVAVAFEGGPTFRNELYPEYKANRAAAPDELKAQVEPVKEIAEAMGISVLEAPGAEADDVIATLARKAEGFDEVVILTGDKDLMQLVNDRVHILAPKSGVTDVEELDSEQVREKTGVRPEQIRDLLTLAGDSSDNVPGVSGIGNKTAAKLLAEFGTLDAIYADLKSVSAAKTRAALEKHVDDVKVYARLVSLKDDVELDSAPEDLRPGEPNTDRLVELLERYQLRTLIDEMGLEGTTAETVAVAEINLTELEENLSGAEWVAVEIVSGGLLLAAGDERVLFLSSPDLEETTRKLLKTAARTGVRFTGYDTKKLIHKLGNDIVFDCDVMLAAYLLNPERAGYELESLVFEYLGETLSAGGIAGPKLDFGGETDLDNAARRVNAVFRMTSILLDRIKAVEMEGLFADIEVPLVSVLVRLENTGVRIDVDFFAALSREIETRLSEMDGEVFELAGHEFNPNSPAQLAAVLFDEIGLKPVRKTKTGYSTAADVLETLAAEHPLPAKIIEYRQLAKFKGTYVDVLPTLADGEGRVRTSFNQTATSTGRLSSSDPNLQNIPIRTEFGARIRKGFIPADGMLLLSADYSQVELRILAYVAQDEGLAAAFREGKDIHTVTASEVLGVPAAEVTNEHRSLAKAINYGIAYGMGARKFAAETGLSVNEGKEFIEKYFQRYPGVKRYLEKTREEARRDGYVSTLFGRRRYLPDIASDNDRARAAAERAAVNMPVQGTAADVMKKAMIEIDRRLRKGDIDARMILTIHDELLFEVAPEDKDRLAETAVEIMSGVIKLDVPMEVHTGFGENWLEAHS
jgi:DNA polymerase-1